jgi:DNA polymerase-3 subunit beta
MQVTCGRSSFNVPKLPVEDYPALPSMPDAAGSVEGSLFATAVAQVAVAAGRDDTLPTLTGMRVEISGARVVLAATDRYRLAVREFDWQPGASSASAELLIPARTIADAAKSFAAADAVQIALPAGSEGLVGFEAAGRRTTSRLLDGQFPNFRTLLPSEASTTADVETAALVEAVKRVALVAERNTPVRLTFSGDEVSLRAGAGDDATATEAMDARTQGDDIEIAFNPAYLQEGLLAMGSAHTRLSFTVPQKPAVLGPVDEPGGTLDPDYRYLLMPVRLTG